MDERTGSAAIIEHARAAADALQQLSRATAARPSMTPADVDVVLADLAAAVAALPQAASQLSDILERAKARYVLAVDNLIEARDPDLVIDRARLHLDDVHEPAARVSRLLDAAHNDTAHISASEHIVQPSSWLMPDVTPFAQPPEEHGPGAQFGRGRRPGPPR